METNGYHPQSMASNGSTAMNGSAGHRNRPFTVDEALPYSPFSSVVPFNSDIIPLPSIGHRPSASLFSKPKERDEGRRGLESLNQEAEHSQPHSTTHRLQRTLDDLKQLLRPEDLTHFKFKVGPKATSKTDLDNPPKVALSPFANLVYTNTNVEYSYPPPSSSSLKPSQRRASLQKQKATLNTKQQVTQNVISNQQSHKLNQLAVEISPVKKSSFDLTTPPKPLPSPSQPSSSSKIAVVIPRKPASFDPEKYTPSQIPSQPDKGESMARKPKPAGSSPAKPIELHHETPKATSSPRPIFQTTKLVQPSLPTPTLAVVIPDLSPTFRQQDYEVVPVTPDTPVHLSKKRKRSEFEDEDELTRGLNQREKAESALRNLDNFLQDIFEAEDQFQPDNQVPNVYLTNMAEDVSLSASAQTKIESLLVKVIEVGKFSEFSLEDLLRLQKLCDGTTKYAESIEVKVDEEMGDAEIDEWLQQIPKAELGLKSARTSLRLMVGGRDEEKQLYSEERMQASINAFKNITEACIIPIVEMRSSGSSTTSFKLLSARKKDIINLLAHCRRLLSLLASLVRMGKLSDANTSTLESMASRLIFAKNAQGEKDSIPGISKFENFRIVAMDALAQIFFASNPEDREGILTRMLTSLDVDSKQKGRQFKLPEGGNIQLVSALIMRLVQVSTHKTDDTKEKRKQRALNGIDGTGPDGHEPDGESTVPNGPNHGADSEKRAMQQSETALGELENSIMPLRATAYRNATYIVNYMVGRAMTSTKTGETSWRNLLDLFVEDFINCLKSPDWPAAGLLLRLLLTTMLHLINGDKTAAPAKNMALDIVASIGAAIAQLNSHVRSSVSYPENSQGDLGRHLSRLAEESLSGMADDNDLIAWTGPFRVALEYLNERCTDDSELRSATAFYMAEWAHSITTYGSENGDQTEGKQSREELGKLAYRLRMMIADTKWLSTEYTFEAVSQAHARLAYALTILHSELFRYFPGIVQKLLGDKALTSEQATVRSKSLKSIAQLVETDPMILDWPIGIERAIRDRSNDASIQVRDSALALIGKCISLRPALQNRMMPAISRCVHDANAGVQKRAMKLVKEIYLSNASQDDRCTIAKSLLSRVEDQDEGVRDLARQIMEEVWMYPFYNQTSAANTSAQVKLAMDAHVALLIEVVRGGVGPAEVFEKVIRSMLTKELKESKDQNLKVCRGLVARLFEIIIDLQATEKKDPAAQKDGLSEVQEKVQDALQLLKVFAKSNSKLFTPEQIQLLQPYISNVTSQYDAKVFQIIVIIFRNVLGNLSRAHEQFLKAIRGSLQESLTKFTGTRSVLDDIVACLWVIGSILNDVKTIAVTVSSLVVGILKYMNENLRGADTKKLVKYLLICGAFGKHCDLDKQHQEFQKKLPNWKGTSVPKLLVDTFLPFSSANQPIEVRKPALDAIGMVCEAWPRNFSEESVCVSFLSAFNDKIHILEATILRSFKVYLKEEEDRSAAGNEGSGDKDSASVAKLEVMGGGQGDGVAPSIAQRYLDRICRIALASEDEQAVVATQIIASISRQGLVHPKEFFSTLIALETSQNSAIVDEAFRAHRKQYEDRASMLGKEYMRAVQKAYDYQREVLGDCHGVKPNSFTSKLSKMIEVFVSVDKSTGPRKKFYQKLCSRIDFDLAKMALEDLPNHLQFSQFIIENMVFFDYATIDELLCVINAMEKVVSGMGTVIAHAIETEVLHISLDQTSSQLDENLQPQQVQPITDPIRLKQLAGTSSMFSILWEARTYLLKQYGLTNYRNQGKAKGVAKDLSRQPIKVQGITGDKFWDTVGKFMSAMDSDESMVAQCKHFVETLTIDHDFKLAAEGDDDLEMQVARFSTPSEGEEGSVQQPGSGRGRKRKSIVGGMSTPANRKKRARSSSVPRSRGRPKGSGKKQQQAEQSDEEVWD